MGNPEQVKSNEEKSKAEKSVSNLPKLPKMKAFKAIRKSFAVAGISPQLAAQSCPLNREILMGFFLITSGLSFTCVFILNYVETFSEYIQSTYIASMCVLILLLLAILILEVEKLFEFIDRSDGILNMSKRKFKKKLNKRKFPTI